MKNISPFVRNLLILAVIAAAVVVLNQEVAVSVVGALVRVAFFIAIAVVVYFFWRDFGRREIVDLAGAGSRRSSTRRSRCS